MVLPPIFFLYAMKELNAIKKENSMKSNNIRNQFLILSYIVFVVWLIGDAF